MREWSSEVVEIGTQLVGLKSDAANELLDYLKTNYGIEPPNIPQVKKEEKKEEKPPEKTEFDVILDGYTEDSKRIGVIKTYREITGASLKDAMASINALPGTPAKVKDALPKAEAEKLKAQLEEAGGKVSLK